MLIDDVQQARDRAILDYVQTAVLQPDEAIRWKGRPSPAACARLALVKSFFGLFFFGFACFWTFMASAGGLFALFGLPFIGVGGWLICLPLLHYRRAFHTYYAITDRRVLIVTARTRFRINAVVASEISDYEREDKGDGSGDIRLKTTLSRGRNGVTRSTEFADGLWGVDDVKGAADAIQALRS